MLKAVLKGFGISVLGVGIVSLLAWRLDIFDIGLEPFAAAVLINFWGAALAAFYYKNAPYKSGFSVVLINSIISSIVICSVIFKTETPGDFYAHAWGLITSIFYIISASVLGLIGIVVGKKIKTLRPLSYVLVVLVLILFVVYENF